MIIVKSALISSVTLPLFYDAGADFTGLFSVIGKHAGTLTKTYTTSSLGKGYVRSGSLKDAVWNFRTWSTLGKYWMRKPRRIPATIPPATSSTPLRRLYQVEPGAKHTPILAQIGTTWLLLGRHGQHHFSHARHRSYVMTEKRKQKYSGSLCCSAG